MPKLRDKNLHGRFLKWYTIRRISDHAVVFRGFALELFGRSIGVHVFENADDLECFHTHPAVAWRFVLWGGYVEEVMEGRWDEEGQDEVYRVRPVKYYWRPGDWGRVPPEYEHRIDGLLKGRSVSLWLRGRITDRIKTRGC